MLAVVAVAAAAPALRAQSAGNLTSGATPAAGVSAALLTPALVEQVQRLAQDAAARVAGGADARVEIEVGQLDPQLRLAPCERIEPYLPTGMRATGQVRLGLRCLQGPTRWNVYLPVTVRLFGRALVAAAGLPAGTVLEAQHLKIAEVDLAASAEAALRQAELAVGRTLARPLAAGSTLRSSDLRLRQWFNAGDTVRLVAIGNGFSVSAEGQALSAGLEGQNVRVRTESGRVVMGVAAGERRVEVLL